MNIKVSVNPENTGKENGCCCKEMYPGRALFIALVGGAGTMPGRGQQQVVSPRPEKSALRVPGASLSGVCLPCWLGRCPVTSDDLEWDRQAHALSRLCYEARSFFSGNWKVVVRSPPFHVSRPLEPWIFTGT